ncbi:MAG: EutN/CcmL family microcompartment protein [Lachnospiraceae bacterium]
MLIARVTGNIVSTQKHEDYVGHKLLLVRSVDLDGNPYGPELVVVDGADSDAGVGDLVLVIQEGGSARHAARCDHLGPIDTSVIAIVDSIQTVQGSLYG